MRSGGRVRRNMCSCGCCVSNSHHLVWSVGCDRSARSWLDAVIWHAAQAQYSRRASLDCYDCPRLLRRAVKGTRDLPRVGESPLFSKGATDEWDRASADRLLEAAFLPSSPAPGADRARRLALDPGIRDWGPPPCTDVEKCPVTDPEMLQMQDTQS